MNNLQYIVKDNTRFAQHIAVELCEQGDFDSVPEAFRWLMQECEAVTLGKQKAKAHPYGYEPDTGAFDTTRCECDCINDISARYCNDCGGEIEVDMNAEKEIYHTPLHFVYAIKHDDGSLEFNGKRYVTETQDCRKLTAEQVRVSEKGGEAMNMLTMQADSLRKHAERLRQLANGTVNQGFQARQDLFESAAEMCETADTIDNLRDSLNEVADKWASEKIKAEDYARENMILKANNSSRWYELFGTPERAAHTSWYMLWCKYMDCDECPISDGCDIATDRDCDNGEIALLEWLKGSAE